MHNPMVETRNQSVSENGFAGFPEVGSEAEIMIFRKLQEKLCRQFEHIFPDKLAPKTVVVIPSLTMDEEILSKVSGINHYEERMLCLLMLLRMPRTNVIYVTSQTIDPVIIDYYLHMLPGMTGYHALRRLTLLSCHDSSSKSLTRKILDRPRLLKRIHDLISGDRDTHMACFNVTAYERTLATRLQIPIFGCDPDLADLGNKSNSRKIFRECGLLVPPGFEDLGSEEDIIVSLSQLKKQYPRIRKAVVKVNDGFSGEGNAIFSFSGIENATDIKEWVSRNIREKLKMVAVDISYDLFIIKLRQMGGIVEAFIDGERKESPSVQCRITPTGISEILSTHDQELGGESGQVYIGAQFPAAEDYAVEIGQMGKRVSDVLRERGVLGRFAVDFISVKENDGWKHYAIEINLRKGGTTHPFLMLQFLTNGTYNADDGKYYISKGNLTRYYFTSDNLKSDKYIGLTPHDLIDIAMMNDLHFDGTIQEGVMFHLIGALSQYGKLGVVCVGSTPERAREYYTKIIAVLDNECK
ncbi:peptide ligase PGM1-related protein [Flavitalea sp.]|nr:peptide ligase PGM1-related protein [Flavitalea sp.]